MPTATFDHDMSLTPCIIPSFLVFPCTQTFIRMVARRVQVSAW